MKEPANRDQVIIYLAAKGMKNCEIAESLGMDAGVVGQKLKDERMLFEIKHLRYKLYGKDHKKRFNDILPHALDVAEEILMNPNAKPQLRFQAAQEVMDRALGKPKQTLEHEGSLIRSLFDKLDGKEEKPIIDVDAEYAEPLEIQALPRVVPSNPNVVEKVTPKGNPNFDHVDEWVKNNL